ncbi:MAG: Sugar phosphate isomerase/epimerase, partial [Candidatus Poribacteria bacterium]|nr:Sugar phosphate isomerase/epimerase [Candidatus Poribacteria bacterium]
MTTDNWNQAADKDTTDVPPVERQNERSFYALWAFREPGEETLGVAERAVVLKKHGYAGFSGFPDQVDDARAYEKERLLVPGLYFAQDASSYEKGYWERMVAPLMKHYSHDSNIGAVWLDIHSDNLEKHRGAAIQIIQDAAAWAQAKGKKVHLYPHAGSHFPNACRAVEYLKQAECEHLGIVFTLYH